MRGKTKKVFCKHCGAPFFTRVADLNRGWGVFCSKSCKAKYQSTISKSDKSIEELFAPKQEYLVDIFSDLKSDLKSDLEKFKFNSPKFTKEQYGRELKLLLKQMQKDETMQKDVKIQTSNDIKLKEMAKKELRKMCEEAESIIS